MWKYSQWHTQAPLQSSVRANDFTIDRNELYPNLAEENFHEPSDLLIFSNHIWANFCPILYAMLLRFSRNHRVFIVEPIQRCTKRPHLLMKTFEQDIRIVTPYLQEDTNASDREQHLKHLLAEFMVDEDVHQFVLWYRDRAARAYSQHLKAKLLIYDPIENDNSFHSSEWEQNLLQNADLVLVPSTWTRNWHEIYGYIKLALDADYYIKPGGLINEF